MNPTTGHIATAPVAARELLHRVADSPHFQKSKRLRALLLYLGERGLQDPNCILREQEIGADVFGRLPDYDTSHDTLVRVQVSQLRKRLQSHFAEDGRDEPLIIEIPKGSYLPVFHPRTERLVESEVARRAIKPALPKRKLLIGMLVGMGVIGVAWGLYGVAKPAWERGGSVRGAVDSFWNQLFGNGQGVYLVMSDITLIEFEKLIGRPVPLSEYEAHEFDRLAELYIADSVQRALAREFVNRVTTAVSDVQVARDLGVLAAGRHVSLNLISARDLSSSLISSQNIILLGSWRANPWVGLFEDQMTFQTDYHETPPSVQFINRAPLPGEPMTFGAEWRRNGYCRVTFLPNPRHTGNVLIISGSDVISTEAGGRFVTSEDSMKQLRQKFGLKPSDPTPHFEVLLKTRVVNNSAPWFELVAYRPHKV